MPWSWTVKAPEKGFDRVAVVVERNFGSHTSVQLIGEVEKGKTKTFPWLPVLRDFWTIFITEPTCKLGQFAGLLQQLGAETSVTSLEKATLSRDFVVCDGPGLNYALTLIGKRKGKPDVVDRTFMSLAGSKLPEA